MKKTIGMKFLIIISLILSGFFPLFGNVFAEKSENQIIKTLQHLQEVSHQQKQESLKNDFNRKTIDYVINSFIVLFLFVDIYIYLMRTKEKRKIEKELRKFNSIYPIVINFTPPKGINAIEAGLLVDEYPSERILDTLFYKWQKENLITVKTRKLKNPFRYEFLGNISLFYKVLIICSIFISWFYISDPSFHLLRGYRAVVIGLGCIFIPIAYWKTKKHGIYKTLVSKLKEMPAHYPQYEKDIFSEFFRDDTDGKVNLFNVCLIDREKAKKNLKHYGYEKKRFKKERDYISRKKVNSISMFQVLLICFGGACVLALTVGFWINVWILYLLFCGTFIVSVIDTHVQNYTEEGYKLRNYLLGYRKFLRKCELPKRKAIFEEQKEDIDLIVEYTMIFGLTPKIKKKIEKIIKWPEYTILDYKDRIFNKEKRKEYYKRHPPVFESQYDDEFKE